MIVLASALIGSFANPPCGPISHRTIPHRTVHAYMASPALLWPYMMSEGGVGCLCDRPPLMVIALVGTGLGLPLSEDVLIYGLGAQLATMTLGGRLCILLWALVGVVLSDLCTVAIGSILRTRASELRKQALPFLSRLLRAISRQLDFEVRRDARRLERQLRARLQATMASASELLAGLRGEQIEGESNLGFVPPPLPPLLRLTAARRLTCNTRSALAAAGQAGPRFVAALSKTANRHQKRLPPASVTPASAPLGQRRRNFAAGVDNRLGLGQRWPLALLTGLDAPVATAPYAAGALTGALVTVPLQLGVGALLRGYPRVLQALNLAVCAAQLCRFGPLWAAIGSAVVGEVRDAVAAARPAGQN